MSGAVPQFYPPLPAWKLDPPDAPPLSPRSLSTFSRREPCERRPSSEVSFPLLLTSVNTSERVRACV